MQQIFDRIVIVLFSFEQDSIHLVILNHVLQECEMEMREHAEELCLCHNSFLLFHLRDGIEANVERFMEVYNCHLLTFLFALHYETCQFDSCLHYSYFVCFLD